MVLSCLVLGCAREERLVVSVNGRKLTEPMLEKRVELMLTLQRAAKPKLSALDAGKLKKQLESTYPQLFISNSLLEEFAATSGIQVAKSVLTNFQARAVRHCRGFKAKDWAGLQTELGAYAGEFDGLVMAEARREAVRDWLVMANPTNLPPDYAAKKHLELIDFNRRIDATNVWIFAHATNVWKKIVAGADFGDMAAKYSDLPVEREERGEWATLDWKQIKPDEELYKWAKKLAPGEISPPIEADGGIMIARIDEKGDEECKISRIFFKQAVNVVIMSEDEIVKFEKMRYARKLFARKMAELQAAADIVYGKGFESVKAKER